MLFVSFSAMFLCPLTGTPFIYHVKCVPLFYGVSHHVPLLVISQIHDMMILSRTLHTAHRRKPENLMCADAPLRFWPPLVGISPPRTGLGGVSLCYGPRIRTWYTYRHPCRVSARSMPYGPCDHTPFPVRQGRVHRSSCVPSRSCYPPCYVLYTAPVKVCPMCNGPSTVDPHL